MFGFDDALALANTKAGAELAKGIGSAFASVPDNLVSGGGPIDARSFMDGAGWTVSTGRSKATGATVVKDREDSPMLGLAPSATQATLGGPLGLVLMAGVAFALWRANR